MNVRGNMKLKEKDYNKLSILFYIIYICIVCNTIYKTEKLNGIGFTTITSSSG